MTVTRSGIQATSGSNEPGARNNSFDGLRLLAAVFVVVGHGFVLTAHGPAPLVGGVTVHALGVDVFFVISGYLVSESWLRDSRMPAFFARRVLRIFPALACLVFISIFVVGPTISAFGARDYFAAGATWAYLQNLLLIGVYQLPGVFTHGHWTSAVNGCLWTLGLEFIGYVVIALGRFLPRRRASIPLLALLTLGIALVLAFGTDTGFGADGRVWVFFALGGLARHSSSALVLRPKTGGAVLAAWALLGIGIPTVAAALSWIVVPFVVLTLGNASLPVLRSAGRGGDLSYGLYLWGFLVQQLVIDRFGDLTPALDIPVVLACSAVVAWLSWHNIESPALQRKPAAPTRARLPALRAA